MDETRKHWDEVYCSKAEGEVSWFQEHPERSLAMIETIAHERSTSIIDVGGGASRIVDELLIAGYADLTVLDISEAALGWSKARLGPRAANVKWIVADITNWSPDRTWGVWHDRAVFHFLTDAASQKAYIKALDRATAPGAAVIIATFALDGPERCSGLPVQRYSPDTLAARLGPHFHLVGQQVETHLTPKGAQQRFQFSVLKRG